MDLRIRLLRKEDAPELARMEGEIFSQPWSGQAFAELTEREYNLYVVAESDEGILGCAGLTLLDNEGDITKVMVRESCRGQGIAYRMLLDLMGKARERGAGHFTLEVRVGNRAAIRLYEKAGFTAEGIRPGFYEKPAEDALIMWLHDTGQTLN